MIQLIRIIHLTLSGWMLLPLLAHAQTIMTAGVPAQLDIRAAGEASIRITLKPLSYKENFPYTPAVVEKPYQPTSISLRTLAKPLKKKVGNLVVEVRPSP